MVTNGRDTVNNRTIVIIKDSYTQKVLRELSTINDFHRPASERFLNAFYGSLSDFRSDLSTYLPHSDLFYCRAALEAKFPDRTFTISEVEELILEIYGVKY